MFLIISPRPFKLQRCIIPHFKALDLLFWPLDWLLTLRAITFAVWSKTFGNFFVRHPLVCFNILQNRGCLIKKFPNVLPNFAKTINPRIKSQAKCQIYFLRALKWGIIHLCTLNTSRDTMKFRKLLVFQFLHFCKKIVKSLCKIPKNAKIQKIDAFCFQSYLHYYLTYTDIQYLI